MSMHTLPKKRQHVGVDTQLNRATGDLLWWILKKPRSEEAAE